MWNNQVGTKFTTWNSLDGTKFIMWNRCDGTKFMMWNRHDVLWCLDVPWYGPSFPAESHHKNYSVPAESRHKFSCSCFPVSVSCSDIFNVLLWPIWRPLCCSQHLQNIRGDAGLWTNNFSVQNCLKKILISWQQQSVPKLTKCRKNRMIDTFQTCKTVTYIFLLEALLIYQVCPKNIYFWDILSKNGQQKFGHLTSRIFIYNFFKGSWKFRHSSRFVCFLQFRCIWPFLTNWVI